MNDNLKLIMGNETNDIANKFYKNLNKNISLVTGNSGSKLDLEWIDKINEAVHYIDNIFDNPKRFIIGEEEILNIEKSKKVTIESIKHLSKHSNFISEYDEENDDVRPSKLLNVLKEETFNTYENRFIYTLVDLIDSFVHRMEEKMAGLDMSKNDRFFCDAVTNVDKENIKMEVKLASVKEVNNNDLNQSYSEKIANIKSRINAWKKNVVYTSLKKEKAVKVTNPLKRTNVILKNPNFIVAASLWDYLNSYQEVIEEGKYNNNEVPVITPDLQKLLDTSLLMYYVIMKMSAAKDTYEIDKYKKYLKSSAVDVLSNTTEFLMDDFSMDESELVNVVSKRAQEFKNKKSVDDSIIADKISSAIKKFTEKVENSYFTTKEEVQNENNKDNSEDNI